MWRSKRLARARHLIDARSAGVAVVLSSLRVVEWRFTAAKSPTTVLMLGPCGLIKENGVTLEAARYVGYPLDYFGTRDAALSSSSTCSASTFALRAIIRTASFSSSERESRFASVSIANMMAVRGSRRV